MIERQFTCEFRYLLSQRQHLNIIRLFKLNEPLANRLPYHKLTDLIFKNDFPE